MGHRFGPGDTAPRHLADGVEVRARSVFGIGVVWSSGSRDNVGEHGLAEASLEVEDRIDLEASSGPNSQAEVGAAQLVRDRRPAEHDRQARLNLLVPESPEPADGELCGFFLELS